MIIKQQTDLGKEVLSNPHRFNGFMGVSICHRFFAPKRMKKYIQWGQKYFNQFHIILFDDPDMYNFHIFKNLPFNQALEKARTISDEIKRSYLKIINKENITNIKIVQCRDFNSNNDYQIILKKVKNQIQENKHLEKSLRLLMNGSIGGKIDDYFQKNNFTLKEKLDIKKILFNYIIEEFTTLIYYTEKNFLIELDPTIEFTTKTKLYNNEFPGLLKYLSNKRRGHIYLHPKGTIKSSY